MIHRHPAGRLFISLSITLSLAVLHCETSLAAQSATNSTGIAVDACALLSAAEISAIVHFDVESGVRRDSGEIRDGSYEGANSTTCLWKASEDDSAKAPHLPLGGARFVILNVMSWPAGSPQATKFLQEFRDAAEDHTISSTPVSLTLGDESLWWGDGVAVRKGHISYGISVHSVNERSLERQMAEAMASKIVARL